jgi:hypothetical protein
VPLYPIIGRNAAWNPALGSSRSSPKTPDGKATTARRYDLLAQPLAAARLAQIVRARWRIENRLPWLPGVAMDAASTSICCAPTLIRLDPGWDDACRLQILAAVQCDRLTAQDTGANMHSHA